MDDEALMNRLSKYPVLKQHIKETLDVVENSHGDMELADTAEERLIETGRKFNRKALQSWANNQVKAKEDNFQHQHKQAHKDSKIGLSH